MTPRQRQACAVAGLALCLSGHAVAQETLTVVVSPVVQTADMPRLGVNLGPWSHWGASQFMANVIKNPGFEGNVDRTLVIVGQADFRGFFDDTTWTGRPDGFWAGARFDVMTGPARGASGALIDSRQKGAEGFPQFATRNPVAHLGAGDVVVLTRVDDAAPPASWAWPANLPSGLIRATTTDRRPGSPGARSLILETLSPAQPARILSYLDAISDRAGKLLPIDGEWRLSLWARADSPDARLRLTLQRHGSTPFLQETLTPTRNWQLIERRFTAKDTGPTGTVQLELLAENGRLLVDDASLAPVNADPSGFRAEVVEALKRLQPGYLRDWQGQLGDTWTNRVAPPLARRTTRYRPGPDDGAYLYGLPEFLDLCKRVGSQPWVTLPTTLMGDEYEAFGRYLAQRSNTDGFTDIIVEFGNENWNPLFRPGGIPDPATHGRVAAAAFDQVRKGAGPAAPLRFAVDGQHVNPSRALRMLEGTPNADLLVVAPYLLYELDQPAAGAEDSVWSRLFATDPYLPETWSKVIAQQRELAVYEVNLHTTRGNANIALRNQVVTGAAAGSALAKRLLQGINQGIRRQCLWNLAQYDTYIGDQGSELLKLWGVTRDLGATLRLRPTGLALALLNQALPGKVHALTITGESPGARAWEIAGITRYNQLLDKLGRRQWLNAPLPRLAVPVNETDTLSALAVRRSDGWALALVSSSSAPRRVNVVFPENSGALPRRQIRLDAATPASSNEDDESVKTVAAPLPDALPLTVTVPPYGLVVLTP